jgi:transcriptional regulator with XRE-family HTH domain
MANLTTQKHGGDAMERSLAQLRAKKHWSLQHAATLLEVDASTLNRWEHGKNLPRGYSIERLCTVYGCTEAELGLQDTSPSHVPPSPAPLPDLTDAIQPFLVSDPTLHLLSLAFSPLSCPQRQREVIKFLEEQSMQENPMHRREALRRLAMLPIATLHLSALMPTISHPPETVLSQCDAGIIACWYLRKGKELALADSTISAYIPTLREIVRSSSQHRKAAADLLVQCYLLKAALSYNVASPLDGIGYAQQAEKYSLIAEKPLLQVAALRTHASVLCYANQWEQALHAELQAKQIIEHTPKDLIPPLARSYVYAGVATYQAYHKQKQDALTSLKQAHVTFFEQAETDVVPLWIDHSIGNLLLNDGLAHAHLELYKGAVDSFAQVEQHHAQDTTIPFGCRVEIQIEQVLAEVNREDQRDMNKCIALWTQGITGVKAMQSNKHFSDALAAYMTMKAAWPGEKRVKELRELIVHW